MLYEYRENLSETILFYLIQELKIVEISGLLSHVNLHLPYILLISMCAILRWPFLEKILV